MGRQREPQGPEQEAAEAEPAAVAKILQETGQFCHTDISRCCGCHLCFQAFVRQCGVAARETDIAHAPGLFDTCRSTQSYFSMLHRSLLARQAVSLSVVRSWGVAV